MRQSAAWARRNRIGCSALIALLCSALAAFGLSTSGRSAPGSAPDVRSDGESLSWSPVGDAQSYIFVAEVEGKTVRQDVVSCCFVSLRDLAGAWVFLRANIVGSAWSRPYRLRVRPPADGRTSGPPITPPPPTITLPPPTITLPPPTITPPPPTITLPPPTITPPPPTITPPPPTITPPPTSEPPVTTPPITPPPVALSNPAAPPAQICGNSGVLSGPSTPPPGAVTVPAGDNGSLNPVADTTYWFAPGTHTFGSSQFGQIIPADNDVFIGAPGAILDGRNINQYAFTQHATGVTVEYLTIQNFGAVGGNQNEGVVNASSGHGWTIQYNTVQNNAGAGIYIGSNNTIRYNCIATNGQAGFGVYEPTGVVDIVLDHNEITGNNTYDWERHDPGCGCVAGGKFWDTNKATVTNNWVHDNKGPGLWSDTNNNDFNFENNYINNNDGEGIIYEISYNARIVNNTLIRNALVYGPGNPGFPTGAIYLSEAGGDSRVPARYTTIEITGNQFIDNWSGVVLWEDADRFCGSPNNPSSEYCTLVNPSVVNLGTCVSGTINTEPYYSDCRWKTQNVSVHDNNFSINPAAISGCTPAASCGVQGLFSNEGSSPSWSPYKGEVIKQAMTFNRNNRFTHNTYSGPGPWTFMLYDAGRTLNAAQWQEAPYGQDRCSRFASAPPQC